MRIVLLPALRYFCVACLFERLSTASNKNAGYRDWLPEGVFRP